MRRCLFLFLPLALCLASFPARAAIEDAPPIPLPCESAILIEAESGQAIFEFQADTPRPIASVTKIMPILLVLEAVEQGRCTLADPVNVSARAASMGGSQVLLAAGETQPLGTILKSMIVASANDATVAAGEFLYGSEQTLVGRMNERARALGLSNTQYANSTGLPVSNHFSSARDVANLSAQLLRHPLYFDYSTIWMDALDHGDGRVTELTNTNRLTRLYEGCDGVKTGSTKEAGYCMAASAMRSEMRLIAVVLGAKSSKARFEIASAMLDHGFANYRVYRAAKAGTRVRGKVPVTGGARESVDAALGRDMAFLIAKDAGQSVELRPALVTEARAPIAAGDPLGRVDVLLSGKLLGQVPVVAAESVARQRYGDALARVMRHCFQ